MVLLLLFNKKKRKFSPNPFHSLHFWWDSGKLKNFFRAKERMGGQGETRTRFDLAGLKGSTFHCSVWGWQSSQEEERSRSCTQQEQNHGVRNGVTYFPHSSRAGTGECWEVTRDPHSRVSARAHDSPIGGDLVLGPGSRIRPQKAQAENGAWQIYQTREMAPESEWPAWRPSKHLLTESMQVWTGRGCSQEQGANQGKWLSEGERRH